MNAAEATTTRKPIRCLVVQLARLGDTLQSLMALRAAKQLYPELEIHFIAREKFAAAARRVPWIANVITLPTEALLGPVILGEKSETQALADIARWIAPLVREPWDLAINWSFSEASSYLMGLLPCRVKLGYTRRRDTTFSAADGWSHYIQAIVQAGVHQNIHLTDILTTQLLTALQIHAGDPQSDGNAPVTSKGFFSLQLSDKDFSWFEADPSRKWIGIQVGASHPSKTWDPANWSRLIDYILDRHPEYRVVLLGGKEDQERAKSILAQCSGSRKGALHSAVGESDFDHWASLVSRCQWVLSGDTAIVHLASVLGTRVLNVSVGPVRWLETGPYGNGHYVVASRGVCEACEAASMTGDHACRRHVTPEAVYAAWSYASNEWAHRRQMQLDTHFSQLGWTEELKTVRVFRSRIRNTTDGGGVVYEPIVHRALEPKDWNAMVMGHIARSWYCGWVPPVGQELARETLEPALIKKLRELQESSEVLAKICEEARKTALSLNIRSATLRSEKVMNLQDRDELQSLGKKLMDLDMLVERMGKTHAGLQAFSEMSKVMMHNLRGRHLSELGKETADCYRYLSDGLQILRDWVKFTLNLAKPVALVAVKPATVPRLL